VKYYCVEKFYAQFISIHLQSHSFEFIESELKQLNADKTALKRDIAQLSTESKSSIIALLEACKGLVSNAETPNMENELNIIACETAAQANAVVTIKVYMEMLLF
jgi:chromosome condensin MukBEF ATPase and DNA-binding subunit MukB